MMTLVQHEDNAPDKRRFPRVKIQCKAYLRELSSKAATVNIVEISAAGFSIAHHRDFPIKTSLWLRLPELEPWGAEVKWTAHGFAGCRFDRPLHPAVFGRLCQLYG